MRRLRLDSIKSISGERYLLIFRDAGDNDSRTIEVNCLVRHDNGVNFVEVSPDVFMTGEVLAKPVVAAVIAFHKALLSQASL